MKIVIVGDGKVGFTLTQQLSKEGHNVVVIDSSNQALENSVNVLDVIGIHGNGASYAVQMEADVPHCDLLIAATSTDELNLLCCVLARKLGARHTIARVRNPEYSQQLLFMKEELGLSMYVNPELAAANEAARTLSFPSALKVETFAKGRVDLVEIKLRPGSVLNGLPLHALYSKYRVHILVCAVQRDNRVYIPTGDFILKEGDKINITASPREILFFFRAIGILTEKVRNVMIVGGGKIAYYLARSLTESGMRVKIIEIDKERCQQLCQRLPGVMIIHGDGTDEELLREEGIEATDAFVALTDFDEENIIISMYAGTKQVPKVITKINKLSFLDILGNSGIESVISPKHITSNQIVQYVRAMENSFGSSNVETLHRIVNNQVEALEFRVREKSRIVGVPLKNLQLKKDLLIACIVRNSQPIIPGGSSTIEVGDGVIVVTTNPHFQDLCDILK